VSGPPITACKQAVAQYSVADADKQLEPDATNALEQVTNEMAEIGAGERPGTARDTACSWGSRHRGTIRYQLTAIS
jgi:hypothetical protein